MRERGAGGAALEGARTRRGEAAVSCEPRTSAQGRDAPAGGWRPRGSWARAGEACACVGRGTRVSRPLRVGGDSRPRLVLNHSRVAQPSVRALMGLLQLMRARGT